MLWNAPATVMAAISEWEPKRCKTEKDYERSLLEFLRTALPGIDIVPQYGIGRAKGDICVKKCVLIEVKKDLESTGECQRLIGQMHEYAEWDGWIIILLMGKTCPNMKANVEKAAKTLTMTPESKFFILKK